MGLGKILVSLFDLPERTGDGMAIAMRFGHGVQVIMIATLCLRTANGFDGRGGELADLDLHLNVARESRF